MRETTAADCPSEARWPGPTWRALRSCRRGTGRSWLQGARRRSRSRPPRRRRRRRSGCSGCRKRPARACSASTSILTSSILPARLATSASIAGPRARQGLHQAAQKSTMTGSSRERSITSCSKVSVVTFMLGSPLSVNVRGLRRVQSARRVVPGRSRRPVRRDRARLRRRSGRSTTTAPTTRAKRRSAASHTPAASSSPPPP